MIKCCSIRSSRVFEEIKMGKNEGGSILRPSEETKRAKKNSVPVEEHEKLYRDEDFCHGGEYNPYLNGYNLFRQTGDLPGLRKIAQERINVLISVKIINRRINVTPEEKKAELIQVLKKYNYNHYVWLLTNNGRPPSSPEESEFQKNEILSHLLLEIIFYPWSQILSFIEEQEKVFFKWQTMSYEYPQVMEFLEKNGIGFPEASPQEKETHRAHLESFHTADDPFNISDPIYKVFWTFALDFMTGRDALFVDGFFYIPKNKMKKVLPSLYLNQLAREENAEYYKKLDTEVFKCDRANYLRISLHSAMERRLRNLNTPSLDIDKLPNQVSCLPPCTRKIYDQLRKVNHLKYHSRQQFYLFTVGAHADPKKVDALIRHHFVTLNGMSEQGYKEHNYGIFHCHGQRGSCLQYYTPDCISNIHANVTRGEVNGCPFARKDVDDIEDLNKYLTDWKIPEEDQMKIREYKSAGCCTKACAATFKGVHGVEPVHDIKNPLDYYTESVEIMKPGDPKGLDRDDEGREDSSYIENLFQSARKHDFQLFNKRRRKAVLNDFFVEYQPSAGIWDFSRGEKIQDLEGFQDVWRSKGRRQHDFKLNASVKKEPGTKILKINGEKGEVEVKEEISDIPDEEAMDTDSD